MKISNKIFSKYIANIVIVLTLIFVGVLTYQGGVVGAFSATNAIDIIYAGNIRNNTVSLMFNVYMGDEYIEPILQTLDNYEVKATFFVGGIWVNQNEECFKKIVKSGNEIGSHGYWHKDHNIISNDEQANEILMCEKLVQDICGIKMNLFAPPSGAFNKQTPIIAHNLGYKTIMWSKDTIDWRDQNEKLIFERATNNVKAGDLILMHPTKATADALENIIIKYLEMGLKIDTVGANIK